MPAHPIVIPLWDTPFSPVELLPQKKVFHSSLDKDPPAPAFGGVRRGKGRG